MSELVPVIFTMVRCRLEGDASPLSAEHVEACCVALRHRYVEVYAGQDVTVVPTEVDGEFRITGMFPREFAEARSYE